MTVVVVGASAGLGRALAEELARLGHALIITSRDLRDLQRVGTDLHLRFGVAVEPMVVDLADGALDHAALAARIAAHGPIEAIYLPAGLSRRDDTGDLDADATRQLLDANLTGIACLVAAVWPTLCAQPRATLAGFGSIAAVRGRRNNIVYSAAKRGLVSLFESLRHRAAGTNVRVQMFQVGFLDTQQTFGKKTLLPVARPDAAARRVASSMHRDCGTVWLPASWGWVAAAVRATPWALFRRLDF